MATYYLPNETGWTSSQTSATYLRIKVDQSYNSSTNKSALTITLQARDTDGYREYNVLDDALFTGGGTTFIQGGGGSGYISPRLEFNTPSSGSWANMIDAGGSTKSFSLTVSHNASGAASVAFGVNIGMKDYDGTKPRSFYSKSATLSLQNTPSYTLSISAGTGSSITVKKGSTTLSHGDTIYRGDVLTITFGASTGYNLATHTVNGSTFTSGGTHTVTGAVSVVSTATLKTYTVSYNANGGTQSTAPANQTKTYGVNLTLSSTTPTRANSPAGSYTVTYNANGGSVSPASATAARTTSYSFSSWNTAQGGGGTSYSPGGSYTANAAATLYAQWSSATSTASVTLPTPTRTGYSFAGWYTAASGGTHVTSPYTPSGNVTLYAHWTANTYTVSYNANGHGTAPSAQTKTYDVALTLRAFIANQSGSGTTANYTVTGNANGGTWSGSNGSATRTPQYTYVQTQWNTNSSGTGTQYSSQGSYTANAAATLYAIWRTDTSYTYTYVLPTGTPSKQQSVTVAYNSAGGTSQPSATVSRAMSFDGWYTAATGGTKRTTSSQISANETVYAHYGEGTSPYPSVTLPSPTRSGYTFAGWYTSGGTKVGDGGASYTPTASITLVAHWTPRTYSLAFNAGEHCSITATRNGSTVTPGANAVTQGDVLTINVSTDTGYTVFSINVNGQAIQNGGTFTVNAANVLVSATASAGSHQMTLTAGEGCSVSVYRSGDLLVSVTEGSTSVYVNYGNELTIVFTALPGYEILTHTVNGIPFTSGNVYTVSGPVSIVCDGQQFGVAHISVSDVFVRFSPYIKGGSSMDRYVPFVFTSGEWRRV